MIFIFIKFKELQPHISKKHRALDLLAFMLTMRLTLLPTLFRAKAMEQTHLLMQAQITNLHLGHLLKLLVIILIDEFNSWLERDAHMDD